MKYPAILYLTMIVLSFLVLFFSLYDIANRTSCSMEKKALALEINGWRILKIYIDSLNHNNRTLKYEVEGKVRNSLFLDQERTQVFFQIREGDKIFKEKNSLNLQVLRNGEEKIFELDFKCEI
ncbi:MAG: hypothetical protein ACXIUQ_15220 [Cecembia sp.]